jgi:hypothetical protein
MQDRPQDMPHDAPDADRPHQPGTRRQLTLFVAEPWRARLQTLRQALDPVQASLIDAHVTLCREDEIVHLDRLALFGRVETWAQGPIRLGFGPARLFGGHGVLLPCEQGTASFQALRRWMLQDTSAREHHAHLTLAHPRNPRAAGHTEAAVAACPQALELEFSTVSLIEQRGSAPWTILQASALGGGSACGAG